MYLTFAKSAEFQFYTWSIVGSFFLYVNVIRLTFGLKMKIDL